MNANYHSKTERPFSFREKVRMRGYKQAATFIYFIPSPQSSPGGIGGKAVVLNSYH